MTVEILDMIEDLYNQGLAPEEISDELGIDETEVMEYCSEVLDNI